MQKLNVVALGIALFVVVAGCDSIGNAPSGMSESDAKSAIDKMSPEDKIRFYNSSPMSGPDKEAKFKEIEEATGVKAADVLKDQPKVPGAGAANP